MANIRDEIRSLLHATENEKPLSASELSKLREACDKFGLPVIAYQYTPSAAREFMAEAFGDDDDAEKDTKKNPDGDKGEKLLDKDKKTEADGDDDEDDKDDKDDEDEDEPVEEGEMPDFIKKAKEKKDGEDDKKDDEKDDEKDEDTTSGNIATVPLPMGNFKKKDEGIDPARLARIKARHRMAKMAESRRKPFADVDAIVESLLEDEKK